MRSPSTRLVRRPVVVPPPPTLDADQRAVVDHPGGPLLVLAGPGTGKTTTLVEAVAARVERGDDPDRLLVLTFSRRAAEELRDRITVRVGRAVREPAAFTFHSWSYALLRAFDRGEGGQPPRLLSGAERDVRIHELLVGNAAGEGRTRWPRSMSAALPRRGFARELGELLDRARERGLDGAGLRALGTRVGRELWVSAGGFLEEYLDVLAARSEIDYTGLVCRAAGLLRRRDIATEVCGRYAAVFVDEYQDSDPSQVELLELLAGGGRDLVVVGDPDQSIYAFRGAEVTGILDFPRRFAPPGAQRAPVAVLGVPRRAGAELLAPARAVAARLPLPGLSAADRVRHRSPRPAGPPASHPPEIRVFASAADEASAVADLLRRAHLRDRVPWEQMAVLVRSGVGRIPTLRRALTAAEVPVAPAVDELPISRHPAVIPLLLALRAADVAPGRAGSALGPLGAEALLLSPLAGATPSVLRALTRRLRETERAAGRAVPGAPCQLLHRLLDDPEVARGLDARLAAPVRRVHRLIEAARRVLRGGGTAEDALWAVWDGSGRAGWLAARAAQPGALGRSANRDLDAVLALFQAVARLEDREPRAGVATLLAELEAQQLPGASGTVGVGDAGTDSGGDPGAGRPGVRLLTAHRAKGLEWDLVVVAGLQEGEWPDLRTRRSILETDLVDREGLRPPLDARTLLGEERRLFYVAITRSRRRLVLTAVRSPDGDGPQPSRFLSETGLPIPQTAETAPVALTPASLVARLRRSLIDPGSSPGLRAAAAHQLAALAAARAADGTPLVPAADPANWWGVALPTVGARPVRDPDRPLRLSASRVEDHLTCPLRGFLRREVGARGSASAAQGFGTLLHAIAQLASAGPQPPDRHRLLARLDEVWPAVAFEAPWQATRERAEAEAALDRLLSWLEGTGRTALASEQTLSWAPSPDVVITGSIDRLERAPDGTVHIVDFKTGRHVRSYSDVEADLQLGVYQLAVGAGGVEGIGSANGIDGAAYCPVGGGELVYLRKGSSRPTCRRQPPLDDPGWVLAAVEETAAGLREERFPARPGEHCGSCDVRSCCPAHDSGRELAP